MPASAYEIAGVTLQLTADDPGFFTAECPIRSRFKRTIDSAPPEIALEAQWVDTLPTPSVAPLFDSGGVWRVFPTADDTVTFYFFSPLAGDEAYKCARFSKDFSSGLISMRRQAFGPDSDPVEALAYPLDELAVIHRLGDGRGIELHSAGVYDQPAERGYLFVGVSGAGKTTLSRLWQRQGDCIVLSDDRNIVRVDRRHDREAPRLHGTPWHGEGEMAEAAPAPLSAVFFLEHGPRTALTPIAPAVAAARLLSNTFALFYSKTGVEGCLATCDAIVNAVPCYELQFTQDTSAVDVVRQLTVSSAAGTDRTEILGEHR